jgi:hypothetical protein
MRAVAHIQCQIDALMPSRLTTGSSPTTSAECTVPLGTVRLPGSLPSLQPLAGTSRRRLRPSCRCHGNGWESRSPPDRRSGDVIAQPFESLAQRRLGQQRPIHRVVPTHQIHIVSSPLYSVQPPFVLIGVAYKLSSCVRSTSAETTKLPSRYDHLRHFRRRNPHV